MKEIKKTAPVAPTQHHNGQICNFHRGIFHAISSKIYLKSILRSNDGIGWSKKFEVENQDGEFKSVVLSEVEISLYENEALRKLYDSGFKILEPFWKNKNTVLSWLREATTESKERLLEKSGWSNQGFITPNYKIGFENETAELKQESKIT